MTEDFTVMGARTVGGIDFPDTIILADLTAKQATHLMRNLEEMYPLDTFWVE